jgi:soluble lytic murein transglycosylase
MRWSKWIFLAAIALGMAALACSRSAEGIPGFAEPSAGPSPTASFTPTPTATPTPPPTPTPVPAARVGEGDQWLFYGDWERAIAEYQQARQESGDQAIQAAALLGIGRAYFYAGNHYQALEHLEQLQAGYPETPQAAQAYFYLGEVYGEQQNYTQAAEAYGNYLANGAGVIAAYVWDLRGEMLFAAGDYLGAAESFQFARETPSALDDVLLGMKIARAYALGGDHPSALALYDDLYYLTNNHYTRALIDLRVGQIHTELGQIEQAHDAYFDAVYNYPTAYDSYLALIELVDAGVEVNELNRGLVDYYAGQYGPATEALNRYLQVEPADPASAYYYYGLSTRALGGYEEAITWWDKIIADHSDHLLWDEAWEQKAYTQWAYLEAYPAAVETLLGFVEQVSAHPRAAEFIFDAGLVAEIDGDLVRAIEFWKRVTNTYPDDERAPRALFLAGIAHYRLGEYDQALLTFQRFQTLASNLEERASAFFWTGKAQAALGDAEAARLSWETASGVDPTGYYSERARDLLHGRAPFTAPPEYDLASDPQSERARAEEWIQTTFLLPEGSDLSGLGDLAVDPNLLRGAALWELGLYDQARVEFEQLRQRAASDPAQTYRLANYLIEKGAYRSGIMAARGVLDLAQMDDAATLSAPVYFNRLRFGAYFDELIMPLAQEYDFHPLFVYSLVRQESLFDHAVSSAADARGLMQIIPTTGADIAGNLGWPPDYTVEDLDRPVVNLRFGIDYLDTQRQLFGGDLYAALAAYNGGPGNAQAWKQLAPDDPDLFLEVIRFAETRNYIRGVYELFTIYRYLYNRTP